MDVPKIVDYIGNIDEDLITDTMEISKQKQNHMWIKWAVPAACLCITLTVLGVLSIKQGWFNSEGEKRGTVVYPNQESIGAGDNQNSDDSTEKKIWSVVDEESGTNAYNYMHGDNDTLIDAYIYPVAYGFSISDKDGFIYFPPSFDIREKYGLVTDPTKGLTLDNRYEISKKDLGEIMGTVGQCENADLIGKTVYHFASYPESNAICILDLGGSYEFYYSYGYSVDMEKNPGKTSDYILETYGFPDACARVEIESMDLSPISNITDTGTIKEICELLRGCENIGLDGAERRFAEVWYNTYGNDNVFYDEEKHTMVYKSLGKDLEPTKYSVGEDGTSISTAVPDDDHELAQELWTKGEKCMTLWTKDDFGVFVDFFPSVGMFFTCNGQFVISEEASIRLSELLEKE